MSPSANTSGWPGRVGLNREPAGAVELEAGLAAELGGEVGGTDAGRPDRRARADTLNPAIGVLERDRVGCNGVCEAPPVGPPDSGRRSVASFFSIRSASADAADARPLAARIQCRALECLAGIPC